MMIILKQGDYSKQESDNDRLKTINPRVHQGDVQAQNPEPHLGERLH